MKKEKMKLKEFKRTCLLIFPILITSSLGKGTCEKSDLVKENL